MPVLRDRGGTWIGWPGTSGDNSGLDQALAEASEQLGIHMRGVQLDEADVDNFYHGFDFRITGTTAGGNSISGGILNGDEFTNTSIDYIFSTPIFALGADFNGARTSSGFNWIINGISTPIFSSSPGTGFFGIISSDPFTLVDVNAGASPNELYSLDNFTSGVPEPSSLAFLALGFTIVAGLVSARRTRPL